MTRSKRTLEDIRIDTPCPASWSEMEGDQARRHCEQCELTVHNLAEMNRVEGEALLDKQRSGERVCVRVEYNPDGSCVTKDEPSLYRTPVGKLAASALALGAALSACTSPEPETQPQEPQTEEIIESCEGEPELIRTLGRVALQGSLAIPEEEQHAIIGDVAPEEECLEEPGAEPSAMLGSPGPLPPKRD